MFANSQFCFSDSRFWILMSRIAVQYGPNKVEPKRLDFISEQRVSAINFCFLAEQSHSSREHKFR